MAATTKRAKVAAFNPLIVERKFAACVIGHHVECMDGYTLVLNTNAIGICTCKCHESAE